MTYLPDVVMGSDCVELATSNVSLFGLLSVRSESSRSSRVHHRSYITCLAVKRRRGGQN